jgi:hypothetical protein
MKRLFKLLIPLVIVMGSGVAATLQFVTCTNDQLQGLNSAPACTNTDGVTFTYSNGGGTDQATTTAADGLSGSTFGSYGLLFPTEQNYLNLLFTIFPPSDPGALDPLNIAYLTYGPDVGGVQANLSLVIGGLESSVGSFLFPLAGATGPGDLLLQNIAFDQVSLSFYPTAYAANQIDSSWPNQYTLSLTEGESSSTPEPGTLVLLGTSLMGLVLFAKRRLC